MIWNTISDDKQNNVKIFLQLKQLSPNFLTLIDATLILFLAFLNYLNLFYNSYPSLICFISSVRLISF